MERPKVRKDEPKREVTGEIVYLDFMREQGQRPGNYPDDLSDMAIDMHETTADLYRSQGVRPGIMDLYEKFDSEVSDSGASCASLAEELLKLKEPGSTITFENFIVTAPAAEVLSELKQIRAGELLAADDKQLAIPSNGEHYPILDIKKKDATLTGVGIRVWGWTDEHKYLFTDELGEKVGYPRNCLTYPSNEKSHWYEFEVSFSYQHPEAGYFNEQVTLYVGQRGEVSIGRNVWVSAYGETGYEGHAGKQLKSAPGEDSIDEDVAALADLIAKLVGDEPEAIWHHNDRKMREYISTVASEETQEYLLEWMDNRSSSAMYWVLADTKLNDQQLAVALRDPLHAAEAHALLVAKVNKDRQAQNERAADTLNVKEYDTKFEPWRDRVTRED